MHNQGFNPVWIFVPAAAFFVLVVVLGLAQCGADVAGHTRDTAQAEANRWLQSMGINGKAQCADRDTDNDGYVSCTVVVTDPGGATRIEPLECAGSLTINQGCRAPKAVVRRSQ